MVKRFTIGLIFVQFITLFQFAMPHLGYELNYAFIIKELCRSNYEPRFVECNGSCFLKKAHQEMADKQTEEQPSATTSSPIPLHLAEIAFELEAPEVNSTVYAFLSEDVITHSSRPSTPPPRHV